MSNLKTVIEHYLNPRLAAKREADSESFMTRAKIFLICRYFETSFFTKIESYFATISFFLRK